MIHSWRTRSIHSIGTQTGIRSIKDYGAVGNGTANDTAAINAAFAATPIGGWLFIPVGDYRVTSALTRTGPIRMFGEGWKSRIVVDAAFSAATDVLTLASSATDHTGWALENFAIEPISGTPARHGLAINIATQPFYDGYFRNIKVGRFGGHAFRLLPADPCRVDGFFLITFDGQCVFNGGMYLDKGGDSLNLLGVNCFGPNDGIYVDLVPGTSGGAHGLLIQNPNITSDGSAIYIRNAAYGVVSGGNIEHPNALTGGRVATVDIAGYTLTGTVNTSGTAVTWVSGEKFVSDTELIGRSITINSVSYVIDAVGTSGAGNLTTTLTLASTAGTQTGVAYSLKMPVQNFTVSDAMVMPSYGTYTVRVGIATDTTLACNKTSRSSASAYDYLLTADADRTQIENPFWAPQSLPYARILDQSTTTLPIKWRNWQGRQQIGVSSGVASETVYVPGSAQTRPTVSQWDNRTSVVNTAGTAVTWVSGSKFRVGTVWVGALVLLNGATIGTVASVTNDSALVLTASAGTNTGWSFQVIADAPNFALLPDGRMLLGGAVDDAAYQLIVGELGGSKLVRLPGINADGSVVLIRQDAAIQMRNSADAQLTVLTLASADNVTYIGTGAKPVIIKGDYNGSASVHSQPSSGNGRIDLPGTAGTLYINGGQVVKAQLAAIADANYSAAAPTKAEFDALVDVTNLILARLRGSSGHGLIA